MKEHENRRASRLVPISTAEFDRKVEAGEDIDMHLDWDNAVSIEPGELSPEQKLFVTSKAAGANPNREASETWLSLKICLPQWAFEQLQSDADRQGICQEELAQALILQRLDKQKAVA